MSSAAGFLVFERGLDFEQCLALRTGPNLPRGGILDWGKPAALFQTRADARAAIARTEHYRLAFGATSMPEKRQCFVEPARFVDPEID